MSPGDRPEDEQGGETGSVDSPKIFVNYRREDTSGQALHLYDRLKEHFGAENLFVDVVNLKGQAGLPWLKAIKDEIASQGGSPGVFLVLIGPRWMESMIRRFQAKDASPVDDNVIREIEFALDNGSGVDVIPVLVDTEAPEEDEWDRLPKSVKRLAPLQVVPLRHGDFDADVAALIRLIEDKARSPHQREPVEVAAPAAQPEGEAEASPADPEHPLRAPVEDGESPSAPSPDVRHIGTVVRMLTEGSIVPVLGARVNRADAQGDRHGGGGFPDADQLASDLARRVGLPVGSEPLDLAQVAELVYMTSGEADLYDWLGQILAVQSEPTTVHRFLAGLPSQLERLDLPKRYQMIITTNYDTALEQAFDDANEPFDLAVYVASGQFDPRPRFVHYPFDGTPETVTNPNVYYSFPFEGLVLQRTLIVKIHGGVDANPGNFGSTENYVITQDHYIDYLSDGPVTELIPIQILQKLQKSHCLFLGYTMSDWRLRVFLKRIWKGGRFGATSWAIEPLPAVVESDFWRHYGVDLFATPLADYVHELSDHLSSHAKTTAR